MRIFDRNPREEIEELLAWTGPPQDLPEPLVVTYPYFEIDHLADAAYVYINDRNPDVALTKSITDHINADYDLNGNVVGIEFLDLKIDFGEEFKIKQRHKP